MHTKALPFSSTRVCRVRCRCAVPAKIQYSNANFPKDAEGRTYHLNTKKGEVAPRILSVGPNDRAKLISQLLQPLEEGKPLFEKISTRGFITYTGKFNDVPVSIISTQMGMPNMDFVIRESRAVVDGAMAVVRLGTCGVVQPPARLGTLVLATHGSIHIRRNPDAWTCITDAPEPYTCTLPVLPDPELARILKEETVAAIGAENVVECLNASADSFYSSQGRLNTGFDDDNEDLIEGICKKYPDLMTLEMETFQMLDLARCSKVEGGIKAMALCIPLAERYSNNWLPSARFRELELTGGLAALNALSKISL